MGEKAMSQPLNLSSGPSARPAASALVAVVIVGHNEKHLVASCLSSWQGVQYEPLQLIYVDNESADGTLEFVRSQFPRVKAIHSGGNLGYCGGNNVGIRLALEAGAEFILILNPDTTVYDGSFVRSLVEYLCAHPRVGKVGPRVFLREPGEVQNTVLSWPSIGGSVIARLGSKDGSAGMRDAGEVAVLNGCCVLIRAAAIREVGLYDEEYWCYGDEAEWDWRAEQAGWSRHFVPVDSIIHHQKIAGYDFSSRSNYLMKRNTALWFLNSGKPLALVSWIAVTTIIALGRIIAAPLRGQSLQKYSQFAIKLVRAYAEILWRLITGKKRSMESLRSSIPCHRSF
jgi:GT2 family glycosyltransferase